jgi:hypothetical protein
MQFSLCTRLTHQCTVRYWANGETTSVMRSAHRAAAPGPTSGILEKVVWLVQRMRSKYSGMSGVRLLRCLRNCNGLWSPTSSSVKSWQACWSLEGDSLFTNSVLSFVLGSFCCGEVMMSFTSVVQLCSHTVECHLSLRMPAKVNCASAWANYTAGHFVQNGGSRTELCFCLG